MRLRQFMFLPLVLVSAFAIGAENAAELSAMNSALESITREDLSRHASRLADDIFEGREAGSRGGRAAGGYLARELQRIGLPGGAKRGGYFQTFGGGRNLLTVIEGSDPALKDEFVLVSAHYDHVGYGTPTNSYGPTGFIHNGADDNASGSSAIIELAEALKTSGVQTRRSILLAFWDGEEKGLLGSKYWVSNPTVPLRNVKLMINCDMLGRLGNRPLEIYGTRSAPGLRRLVAEQNRLADLPLRFVWELKENSDHYTFAAAKTPVLMFHSGLHADYHRPSDDIEKLDTAGMEKITKLLLGTVVAAANEPDLGPFRAACMSETPSHQKTLEAPIAKAPSRLGISWDPKDEKPGLLITRVSPNSPASRFGFRRGDRIHRLGKVDLSSKSPLASLIASSPATVNCEYLPKDGGELRSSPLKLAGTPSRLGIVWRVDSAEPNAVILTRCSAGLPAAKAGLSPGDRIYQVDGKSLNGSGEFRRLASESAAPLFDVERNGRWREVTLQPASFVFE